MPFTVSHAAAILPIRARWLSTSALVIGAMTPDLPLFAPFLPYTTDATHTVFGTLVTNTAVGLVLFVIWHGFLARPADWFAPSAIRKRLTPAQQPGLRTRLSSWRRVAGVLTSLLLGGLTHQILDWFTHAGTPITDRFAVFEVDVAGMPLYYFLQIALSIVGLVLLANWAVRWFAAAPVRPLQRQPSTLGKVAARGTVLGAAVGATVATAWGLHRVGGSSDTLVFAVSVTPVVSIAVASGVIALLWHLKPPREVA
jgi:membrane-bound metal-dependent hydrolase YbcI (DUF457 family)